MHVLFYGFIQERMFVYAQTKDCVYQGKAECRKRQVSQRILTIFFFELQSCLYVVFFFRAKWDLTISKSMLLFEVLSWEKYIRSNERCG